MLTLFSLSCTKGLFIVLLLLLLLVQWRLICSDKVLASALKIPLVQVSRLRRSEILFLSWGFVSLLFRFIGSILLNWRLFLSLTLDLRYNLISSFLDRSHLLLLLNKWLFDYRCSWDFVTFFIKSNCSSCSLIINDLSYFCFFRILVYAWLGLYLYLDILIQVLLFFGWDYWFRRINRLVFFRWRRFSLSLFLHLYLFSFRIQNSFFLLRLRFTLGSLPFIFNFKFFFLFYSYYSLSIYNTRYFILIDLHAAFNSLLRRKQLLFLCSTLILFWLFYQRLVRGDISFYGHWLQFFRMRFHKGWTISYAFFLYRRLWPVRICLFVIIFCYRWQL